ncbi:MAG: cadherin domain-containing protein [Planctomycetota bacterium]
MSKSNRWTREIRARRSSDLRRMHRRRLLVEGLESRELMASDTFLDPFGNRIGFIPTPPASLEQNAPPANGAGGSGSGASGNAPADPPLSDTFKLHSRPSATKTIYLDFDGFTARGTPWNTSRGRDPIISPAYDPDRNGPDFTNNELRWIQTIWQRVASDFASFDLNVTTEDPGEEALVNTGGSDDRWGIRVVMTPDDFPAPGAGGVAYIGSFRWGYNTPGATDTPCYVFNIFPANVSLAVSHEVGHSLGLSHDGTNANNPFQQNAAYYFGHGGTGETSWGPIMGAPYDRNITTWDDGTYLGANNGASNANYGSGPDDIGIIASPINGFEILPDDHGNSRTTASELKGPVDVSARVQISQLSTIERSSDLDFFRLQVGTGLLDLTIDPYVNQVWTRKTDGSFESSEASSLFDTSYWPNTQSANLDVEAKLYDASGALVATSNPNGLLAEFKSLSLTGGIYFLSIDGVGFGDPKANPPTGYSDYGSVGQYLITGSFPVAFGIAVSDSSIEYIENSSPVAVTSTAKVVDKLPGDYSSGFLSVEMLPTKGATDILTVDLSGTEGLTQVGAFIFLNGLQVARFSRTSDTTFQFTFYPQTTTEAIEAIANSIRFEALGDSPDTFARSISITLVKGVFGGSTSIDVNVRSVNDPPIAVASFMDEINEDTTNAAGNTVAQLIERGVFDPDQTTGTGIILTGVASGTGVWQYNTGAGWNAIPSLTPSAGLVLGPTSRLRFVPALNFFGNAPALRYYALDPFYRGGFSGPAGPVFASTGLINDPSSISVSPAEIRQVVRPINDAPIATPPFPKTSVLQDATLSFTVPSKLFKDIDDSILTLSALTATGSPLPSWLSFDSASATFQGTPRNQDVGQQQFIIRATDPSGAYADAPFTLEVINVNDAPYDARLVGQPVPENLPGARVGRLTAIDPDPNDTLTWSVTDTRFEVRGNELFLAAKSSFDFETEQKVEIIARATDNGMPRLSFETVLMIPIADVNEFSPQLTPLSMSIDENSGGGTNVGQVVATDGDTANKVRYRFFGTPPTQFLLNSQTGSLSVKPGVALDYETSPVFNFYVEAYDDGTPSLSTWVSAAVTLRDINEFSPAISTQTLSVVENQPVGTPFGRVLATDGDKQSVSFSLLSSEDRFSIDPTTGDLRLNRADVLDYERSRTELVTVIATDNGTPSFSSQRQIVLQVTNANEPPTSVSVEMTQVRANITGLNLGKLTVQDPDGPTQYVITPLDSRFQVVAGNLMMASGQYLRDSDPQFIAVPLLLNDVSGGTSNRLDIQLERLLNPTPWRNTALPFDVDRSGSVNPLDVLAVINAINGNASPILPVPRDSSSLGFADVDVDGDGQVTPLDVLAIINVLNAPKNNPEGEAPGKTASHAVDSYFAQYDVESDPLMVRSRRSRR